MLATIESVRKNRERYLRRLGALKNERSSWDPQWQEIADYVWPFHWRYFQNERNKGWKRNQRIIDNTPVIALRTLQNGMMAGLTSPARPWVRLTTLDPELSEWGPVREWLSDVENLLRVVLARSNVYRAMHNGYGHLAGFGTSVIHLDDDDHDIIRAYNFPLGQYCLANSARLAVDTCYREFSMTAQQVVEMFGEANVSQYVRDAVTNNNRETWIDVLHIVEPNRAYDSGALGPEGKKWLSIWCEIQGRELGGKDGAINAAIANDQVMKVSGYEEFPILAARWNTTGEDVYGFSPGMDALGDAKALQLLQKRKLQAVDKMINPPMVGATSLKTQRASLLPGDITYVDQAGPGRAFSPAMEVPPMAVQVTNVEIQDHRQRVRESFYADFWVSLLNDEHNMTAREVAERHEEKMLQLGPALESIENEMLDPLIHRALAMLGRRGMLPEPPQEMHGQGVKPEYISPMAQAQKLLGITADERLVAFVTSMAQLKPDILDNIDGDKLLTIYADRLGNKPEVIRDMDEVQALRAERQKQAQAQAQGEAMLKATEGAKNLAASDMAGDNVLSRIVGTQYGPLAAQATGTGEPQ